MILRVEISPKNGDYSTDLATWVYTADQETMPEWANGSEEQRARATMAEWNKYHCCVQEGQHLIGGFMVVQKGGDRSTLTGGDYSTLTGGHGSTLTGGDYSTLKGGDYSQLKGGYGSTLTGGDYSTLTDGDSWSVAVKTVTGDEVGIPFTVVNGEWVSVNPN